MLNLEIIVLICIIAVCACFGCMIFIVLKSKKEINILNTTLAEFKESVEKEKESQEAKNAENAYLEYLSEKMLLKNEINSKNIISSVSESIREDIKKELSGLNSALIKFEETKRIMENNFEQKIDTIGKATDSFKDILFNKKRRGNFGEVQLELILSNFLDKSTGCYRTQVGFTDKTSKESYIVDAVVELADGRNIIIDSKFTLPNLTQDEHGMFKIGEDDEKSIIINLENAIKVLSRKAYENFDKNTFPYKILFIPYENIFSTIMDIKPEIWCEAYDKKIWIMSPHTLIPLLTTIRSEWSAINMNKNVKLVLGQCESLIKKTEKIYGHSERINKLTEQISKEFVEINRAYNGNGGVIVIKEKLDELQFKIDKED